MGQPQQQGRLRSAGVHLAALVQSGRSIRQNEQAQPVDGSQAATEAAMWEAEGRPQEQLLEARESALKNLLATEDCLEVAASLCSDRPPRGFPMGSVLRTAVEASARCYWLLDPKLDAVDRVRRFMRDVQADVKEGKRQAGLLGVNDIDAWRQLCAVGARIAEFAEEEGLGDRRPYRTTLVRDLLEASVFEDEEPDPSDANAEAESFLVREGKSVYAKLSEFAHAEKSARDTLIPGPLQSEGREFLLAEVMVYVGAGAYGVATHRAAIYMGWNSPIWRSALGESMVSIHAQMRAAATEFHASEGAG